MNFWRQKLAWVSIAVVLVVLVVFGAAMMGSVVGAKPKELPVALVVTDQPVKLPTGGEIATGALIQEKLLAAAAAGGEFPIKWELVESVEAAQTGMDERSYYGALVLPEDLSSGLMSLTTGTPNQATVRIIVNEGANTQAATIVKQVLTQSMRMVSGELSKQLLGQIAGSSEQGAGLVPVAAVDAVMTPFHVKEESVHPVGSNQANGNAPGLLTQIMWIGSLITSVILFFAQQRARSAGGSRPSGNAAIVAAQGVTGIVVVGAASAFLVWMASSWYGMELAHAVGTWLLLWLGGVTFFSIQSTLLNWIGMPAMAILVLLMFFSMPVLNMAPEFLSPVTQDWIYSWTPLRFVAEGLREVMYYGGLQGLGISANVLWVVAVVFLVLLLGSAVKKKNQNQNEKTSGVKVVGMG